MTIKIPQSPDNTEVYASELTGCSCRLLAAEKVKELVEKTLATDQLVLNVGYDIKNLTDAADKGSAPMTVRFLW